MKQKLQEELIKNYPKIFSNIERFIGIECGDGWFGIIDNLCQELQKLSDSDGNGQVFASQVKEKFGGLRFYADGTNAEQDENIDVAENLSNITCETCGSMENVFQTNGWIKTTCDKCNESGGK